MGRGELSVGCIGELPTGKADCAEPFYRSRTPCPSRSSLIVSMKFRSNNCVAIYLPDLKKAEAFYTGVMGFRLASKDPTQLEYDTGRFSLCIHKSVAAKPPVPSFTVISIEAARSHLEANHCSVVQDPDGSFHFKDPFGVTYHLVED